MGVFGGDGGGVVGGGGGDDDDSNIKNRYLSIIVFAHHTVDMLAGEYTLMIYLSTVLSNCLLLK